MNKTVKIIIFFIGMFLAIKPVPNLILNYSGYCMGQNRYLSQKEFFDSAALDIIKSLRMVYLNGYQVNEYGGLENVYSMQYFLRDAQSLRMGEPVPPLIYNSLEDFYRQNPDCCRLVDGIPGENYFYNIPESYHMNGEIYKAVRVFYMAGIDVQNDNQPVYQIQYKLLSNCGEVVTPEID